MSELISVCIDRPSKQLTDVDADEKTARERAGEIMDDCDTLASKLAAFEDAWHAVELACSTLSSDLEMAQTFSDVSVNSNNINGNECTDWSTLCIYSCGRR